MAPAPRAVRDTRCQWAYLFGAVCPQRAAGAALVMPYANTEAMNKHLEEIAKAVSPGAHAVLVLDGAGWHGSGELVIPEKHNPLNAAALLALTQPCRNCLGAPAPEQACKPHLRNLRRHRRSLLRCLERFHHHARPGRLHHQTKLGESVMISGGWY